MSRDEDDESIRSHLEAAFKGEPQETEEPKQPEPEDTPEDQKAETEEREAKAEAAAEEKPEAEANGEDEKKEEEPIEPPARWTKEEKEAFAALDPAVQRILATRNKGLEADYTRKMTEVAQERERYKGIEEALAPRREMWTRQGLNDSQALQSIMSYWDLAQRDPWQFVQVFANERGMDLSAAFTPQTNAQYNSQDEEWNYGDEAQLSPQVKAQLDHIARENAHLREQVQHLGGQFNQSQQAQLQEMEAAARNTLTQFESETDANGQPLRPFLNDVREDMSWELKFGGAKDLQEAYDRAVWKRPDVRSKILESQDITRRREEERKRQEEAQRAKRAGASVSVPSTPAAQPFADDEDDGEVSIRDLLKRQFAQSRVAGRV